MSQIKRRLLGLCLMPALLAYLDAALTLGGQSAAYCAGNYSQANEASPTLHHLLACHPLAFAAGQAGWILVFSVMILLMPQTLALMVSIAVTLGHALGAASWLAYRLLYGSDYAYQVCCGLVLLTSAGLAIGIRWVWRAEPRADTPLGVGLPCVLRWVLIAVLVGIAVYLFLWPRMIGDW